MKRKLKVIIASIITAIMLIFSISVNVHASEYDAIKQEVSTLVSAGKLPEYHNYLAQSAGYQTLYTKMYRQGDDELKEYFASLSYGELSYKIKWYENKWDSVWYDILTNLDIEPQYLDPNKLLGLYYDADAGETSSYLYLIWTSKYPKW